MSSSSSSNTKPRKNSTRSSFFIFLCRTCAITFLSAVSIIVLLLSLLFASYSGVDDVLAIRSHPVNRLLLAMISPHDDRLSHLWLDEELANVRNLKETRDSLTAGGSWLLIKSEFYAWEDRHRSDYGPTACMEFEWAPTAILRLYGTDTALLREFPETKRLLQDVPFTSLSFYTLEPHAQLYPHRGLTSYLLRYHLGIEVPVYDSSLGEDDGRRREDGHDGDDDGHDDGFGNVRNPHLSLCASADVSTNGDPGQFGDSCDSWRHYNWRSGRDFVFDDNSMHKAKNPGDERRVIILADFQRPGIRPWFAAWVLDKLILYVAPRIPQISKYAHAYSDHYESLVATKRGGERTRQPGCVFQMLDVVDFAGNKF